MRKRLAAMLHPVATTRCGLFGAVLTIAMFAARTAFPQDGSVCECPDVFDLINRLNMAEAARSTLLEEIPKMEAAPDPDAPADDKDDQGESNQDRIRARIRNGMAVVQALGANTSEAMTYQSCRWGMIKSSTACMDEVIRWHEETVHVPACDSRNPGGGRSSTQSTISYAREEIQSYEAEIARIKDILSSLPATCRPSGWVGHIYYFEQRTTRIQRTMKPGRDLVSGWERSLQTLVREAKIVYREKVQNPTTITALLSGPKMFAVINQTLSNGDMRVARWGCSGGLRTPVSDQVTTFTTEEQTSVTAFRETDVDVGFNYNPATGDYSISFTYPGMQGKGTNDRLEAVTGSCNPAEDGSKSSGGGFSQAYDGSSISVSGKARQPAPDMIQGEERLNQIPPVSLPDMAISDTVTLRWTFFKLP
jgi:hypothetical protein